MPSAADFRSAIEKAGLTPPVVLPPGKLIRFPGAGKHNGDTAGWAKLFEDEQGGVYGDWSSGLSEVWFARNGSVKTLAEKQAHTERVAELQRIRQEEVAKGHAEAAARARAICDAATLAPEDHPYLQRKQIQPHEIGVDADNRLVIPVVIGEDICSVQFIGPDATKKFLPGGAVAGGYFLLGDLDNATTILLGEGYATVASLHEATGYPAVCAFSAGNLLSDATQLRKQFPAATIVLCGDHDQSGVGQAAASKAAEVVNGILAIPKEIGCDWNDIHVQFGLGAVRDAITAALTRGQETTVSTNGTDAPESIDLDEAQPSPPHPEHAASPHPQADDASGTHAPATPQDVAPLALSESGGLYSVTFAHHSVQFLFDRLVEARGGVTAELTVRFGTSELLSGVDLGLKSDTGQNNIVKSLKHRPLAVGWKSLLQQACAVVLQRHREGEPLRVLTVDTPIEPLTFQVNPLVFRGKPTVLFGDGGVGKSSLALLCAMLVSTGETVAGISALPGVALYLDYEDSYDVHVRRMRAIAACHPNLAKADVGYQFCTEPLTSLTPTLLRRIHGEGITFLVLDSLAAATGGDAGAEAATKVFRAIRTLNVGNLILAHIPKPTGEGQDPSIYGSVFFKNFPRATWELRKEQDVDSDTSVLGLFNRKSNLSRTHPDLGMRVTQNRENTRMHYESFDLSQAAQLRNALPWPNQIRTLLESDGVPRSAKEIADELGGPLTTIKVILSKFGGQKWQKLGEGRDTKWATLNR